MKYIVVKAYKQGRRGNDVFGGWDVYYGDVSDGNWCNRFWTRRAAVAALKLEGITL